MLDDRQFKILCRLKRESGQGVNSLPSDCLNAELALSWEESKKALSALQQNGLISSTGSEFSITPAGVQALEPYRVRRMVILAAGFGSRLRPLTLRTPKPMLTIHGTRIVDTLLDAIQAAGIRQVLVVRGYLGERFAPLRDKYPFLTFLDNPFYGESNNISTALCAREWLQNAYICDADLFLKNPGLIRPYEFRTNYLGRYVSHTDDWCVTVRDGLIQSMQPNGDDCYQMYGLSYWDAQDGARLAEDLAQVFKAPNGKQRFWEEIPFNLYQDRYRVAIRPCRNEDILEIDTLEDLRRLDSGYRIPPA